VKPVWSLRATRDLRELITYIAEDSPKNAELVNSRILKSVELLDGMPLCGREGRVPGTRELVVGRTPYIVVYQMDSDQPRILRIYRGARKWPDGFPS
jgi:toxin ParE1/3/4